MIIQKMIKTMISNYDKDSNSAFSWVGSKLYFITDEAFLSVPHEAKNAYLKNGFITFLGMIILFGKVEICQNRKWMI